jgi:hypothetical protein
VADRQLISVVGLKEFNRNLRRMDSELPKGLRLAGNAAAEIVVNEARPRVPIGPGIGGHAKNSIKVASTRTAVRVSAGGARFPYYPWLDFGGRVGRKRSVRRPFLKSGRYIWKAFDDRRADVERELAEQLENLARTSGIEVS